MLKKSELVSLIQIFSVYLHHDKKKRRQRYEIRRNQTNRDE